VPGDIEHWLADKEAAVWRAISSGAVEAMPGAHALIGAAAQRDVSCVVVTNSARIVAEADLTNFFKMGIDILTAAEAQAGEWGAAGSSSTCSTTSWQRPWDSDTGINGPPRTGGVTARLRF